jgi:UDP:flavonoid glycosyltransferase YjiC (YdhE family)
MHRNHWTLDELGRNLQTILTDASMKERLAGTSAQMHKQAGPSKAARLIDELLRKHRHNFVAGPVVNS